MCPVPAGDSTKANKFKNDTKSHRQVLDDAEYIALTDSFWEFCLPVNLHLNYQKFPSRLIYQNLDIDDSASSV